jgi:hypothetical protein
MKDIGSVTLATGEAHLADGWILPAEVQQLVLEAGYDPHEVIEEVFDWYRRREIPVAEAA